MLNRVSKLIQFFYEETIFNKGHWSREELSRKHRIKNRSKYIRENLMSDQQKEKLGLEGRIS